MTDTSTVAAATTEKPVPSVVSVPSAARQTTGELVSKTTATGMTVATMAPVVKWVAAGCPGDMPDAVAFAIAAAACVVLHYGYSVIAKLGERYGVQPPA